MGRIFTGLVALALSLVVLGSVPSAIQTGGLAGGVLPSHISEEIPQRA